MLELAPTYRLNHLRAPVLSPFERRQRGVRTIAFLLATVLGRAARRQTTGLDISWIRCWGVLFPGHLSLNRARSVLDSLNPEEHGQLICHPGDDNQALAFNRNWAYDWELELGTALAIGSGRSR